LNVRSVQAIFVSSAILHLFLLRILQRIPAHGALRHYMPAHCERHIICMLFHSERLPASRAIPIYNCAHKYLASLIGYTPTGNTLNTQEAHATISTIIHPTITNAATVGLLSLLSFIVSSFLYSFSLPCLAGSSPPQSIDLYGRTIYPASSNTGHQFQRRSLRAYPRFTLPSPNGALPFGEGSGVGSHINGNCPPNAACKLSSNFSAFRNCVSARFLFLSAAVSPSFKLSAHQYPRLGLEQISPPS